MTALLRCTGWKQGGWKLLLFALLFLTLPTWAQRKVQRAGAIWPEFQVEYVFKSTSYIYFRNQYRHNLDDELNYLRPDGPLKYLERAQFRAGFEHMFNPSWSGGIAEAYAFEGTRNILFNEVFIRHLNNIGSFRFTERASFEHIVQSNRVNRGRFRFRVDLDREFKLKETVIRPRLAYELFFDRYYDTFINETRNKRTVDRTRLRFEIGIPLNPHLAFTPFFIRQTDFVKPLTTSDATGKDLQKSGKQNIIYPIMGLDIRYAIFKGGEPFPRTIKTNK